ncbi:MAG: hypothetical protein WCK02_01220 [Bacteroidota bacterium]
MDNRKTLNFLIILNVVLILVSGLLAWKLYSTKTEIRIIQEQKEESSADRDVLKSELDSLVAEHNKLKDQYGNLNKKLVGKDSLIQAQINEINVLISNKVDLNRIRKKMDALRRITQNYVHQIDSLFVVNKTLKDENVKIKTDYESVQTRNSELTKAKDELTEKVTTAAVLRAFKITGKGIKTKKRGTVEEAASKAKKVEKIKISFTLLENSLLEAGDRNIYIRIAGPDEKILSVSDLDSYSFENNGERLQYSLKEVVNYDKKNQEVTVYWTQSTEYKTGSYTIDVFTDNQHLGSGGFSLE